VKVDDPPRGVGGGFVTRAPWNGEATLFLFVRDPVASVARPLLELKGVQKKAVLAAGESKILTWRLPLRICPSWGKTSIAFWSLGGSRSTSGRARVQAAF